MGLKSSAARDILRGANIGKWVFELLEKIFPFLRENPTLTGKENLKDLPRKEILKMSFKAAFIVGFGVLFFTEAISIPLMLFNGQISKIPEWLPYSLLPAAVIFVLLMVGGIVITIIKPNIKGE
ncbi:hypothetical protein KY308_00685 [Candidatus Woesearchaeota archaeon]|nr:hypothetical protein [Candidatus Woesearchaeota archaeon]